MHLCVFLVLDSSRMARYFNVSHRYVEVRLRNPLHQSYHCLLALSGNAFGYANQQRKHAVRALSWLIGSRLRTGTPYNYSTTSTCSTVATVGLLGGHIAQYGTKSIHCIR